MNLMIRKAYYLLMILYNHMRLFIKLYSGVYYQHPLVFPTSLFKLTCISICKCTQKTTEQKLVTFTLEAPCVYPVPNNVCTDLLNRVILGHRTPYKAEVNSAGTCVFGPLNVFRSLPEASSTALNCILPQLSSLPRAVQ